MGNHCYQLKPYNYNNNLQPYNSKKVQSTIKKLTSQPPPRESAHVTANQIAHQVLINGNPDSRPKRTPNRTCQSNSPDEMSRSFNLSKVVESIKSLKNGKASSINNISVEQINILQVLWILNLFNVCMEGTRIPRLWRKSKLIALLKTGKVSDSSKNFRPNSLLCHHHHHQSIAVHCCTQASPMLGGFAHSHHDGQAGW